MNQNKKVDKLTYEDYKKTLGAGNKVPARTQSCFKPNDNTSNIPRSFNTEKNITKTGNTMKKDNFTLLLNNT